MYTYGMFSQKKSFKEFCADGKLTSKQDPPIKMNISHHPNIGTWSVYPETMAWNVGAVHSAFNLGERVWRSGPQRTDLKVHFSRYAHPN